jgi:hypothetical protein
MPSPKKYGIDTSALNGSSGNRSKIMGWHPFEKDAILFKRMPSLREE